MPVDVGEEEGAALLLGEPVPGGRTLVQHFSLLLRVLTLLPVDHLIGVQLASEFDLHGVL